MTKAFYKIKLFTTRSLADNVFADKFYDILNTWDFPPTKFDKYEPIRKDWTNKSDFVNAWQDEGQLAFGQVLVRRKMPPSYFAGPTFLFGPGPKHKYHGISLYEFKESQCSEEIRPKLVELADRFFSELEMDYGFLCLSDEYDAKNIIKDYPCGDGLVEPRKVIGMNWPYCIPGLYWINYFGKVYLDHGFAAEALKSYPENVTKVGHGIRFQTSKEPRFFESSEAANAERKIRDALGEPWFFDRENERDCTWINVSLDHLRSPIV